MTRISKKKKKNKGKVLIGHPKTGEWTTWDPDVSMPKYFKVSSKQAKIDAINFSEQAIRDAKNVLNMKKDETKIKTSTFRVVPPNTPIMHSMWGKSGWTEPTLLPNSNIEEKALLKDLDHLALVRTIASVSSFIVQCTMLYVYIVVYLHW